MLYPLQFQPVFQERIWGGRSLESLYGKSIPAGKPIGESWEISDRPEAPSVVAAGPLRGKTLEEVMRDHPRDLMGNAKPQGGRFPLLVKILDAREKLSLQVHPPASKAAQLGGEPKTEMWYITQAEPGAELYVGLRTGATRAEFEQRAADGSVAELFHKVPVQAGDAMFLPSGRVHAIGAGLVIFEIQQNSDTTYRVFDWNRLDAHGKGRTLHLCESLESIDFTDFNPGLAKPRLLGVEGGCARHRLVDDLLFTVDATQGQGSISLGLDAHAPVVVAAVSGSATVQDPVHPVELRPGSFCLIPACRAAAMVRLNTPDTTILSATPGV